MGKISIIVCSEDSNLVYPVNLVKNKYSPCVKIVPDCAESVTESTRHYDIPLCDNFSLYISYFNMLTNLCQNAALSATLT
jgi:hypothetical protein